MPATKRNGRIGARQVPVKQDFPARIIDGEEKRDIINMICAKYHLATNARGLDPTTPNFWSKSDCAVALNALLADTVYVVE